MERLGPSLSPEPAPRVTDDHDADIGAAAHARAFAPVDLTGRTPTPGPQPKPATPLSAAPNRRGPTSPLANDSRGPDPTNNTHGLFREAPTADRYLLCAPRGCGLNDTLVQIWHSYRVARSEGRRLLIDTRLCGFWDDLDAYLIPRFGDIRASVTNDDIARLNTMSCHPRQRQHRIDYLYRDMQLRQTAVTLPTRAARVRSFATGALMTPAAAPFAGRSTRRWRFLGRAVLDMVSPPDFRSDSGRGRGVLVHHTSGGGPESVLALRLFRLAPSIRTAVETAQGQCGEDYVGVHIRNTDLRTDYRGMLLAAREELAGRRVLVCSDDRRAIDTAAALLPDSDIFTVTDTEDTGGRPLHKLGPQRDDADRRRLNTNMLVDLFCLARAERLLVPRLTDGGVSGFGALAELLHRQPEVVTGLFRPTGGRDCED